MYAYAANNPVRYIDPDGRITAIVGANIEFSNIEKEEIRTWIALDCPTTYNPKMRSIYIDMQQSDSNIEKAAKNYFSAALKMQISPDEQKKYIDDEKRIYKKIQLVRLKGESFIKTTNSLIENARKDAETKYQSLSNDKELTRAEKIKISEDYANELLEKKLDLLLENIE